MTNDYEEGSFDTANVIGGWIKNTHPEILPEFQEWWKEATAAPAVERKPTPPALNDTLTEPAFKMDRKQARDAGYIGDPCTNCQSMQVKRNGSCLVCEACGATTGCS